MEVKVTIALDDRTHETLNRLIDALMCRNTHEKAEKPQPLAEVKPTAEKAPESDEEWTKEEMEEVLAIEAKREAEAKSAAKNEAVEQPPKNTAPTVTVEELRALAADVKEKEGNVASVKKLLNEYGVKNVSSLPESAWDAFAAKLRELL